MTKDREKEQTGQDSAPAPRQRSWLSRKIDGVMRGLMRFYYETRFGLTLEGTEHLEGLNDPGRRTVIVPNHKSRDDAMALIAMIPADIRPAFAIDADTYNDLMKNPLKRFLLSRADLHPVHRTKAGAMKQLVNIAKTGQPVVIFPQGRLGETLGIGQADAGARMVAENAGADILPMHLEGFEFLKSAVHMKDHPKRRFPKLTIHAGPAQKAIPAEGLKGKARRTEQQRQIEKTMYEVPLLGVRPEHTYIDALHKAAGYYGMGRPMLDYFDKPGDTKTATLTYGKILTGMYALGEKLKDHTDEFRTGEEGRIEGTAGVMIANGKASLATLALMAYNRVPAMLDPTANIDKLLAAAETARLKTIITSRALVEAAGLEDKIEQLRVNVPEGQPERRIVYLEDLKEQIPLGDKIRAALTARGLRERPEEQQRMHGRNPAIIYFTSGTTSGTPKGVPLTHENILVNIAQTVSVSHFTPASKIFNAMPQFHAFGGTGTFMLPLLHGIRNLQYHNPKDARTIPKIIKDFRATMTAGPSKYLDMWLRGSAPGDFVFLDNIVSGGERLQPDVDGGYKETGIVINEGLGMTETGPGMAMNVKGRRKTGTVGRLLPGIEYKLEPFPGYEEGGVLHVRGRNVGPGYLLHDDPGRIQPHGEWLNTGDIVKIDDEGYVTVIGRAKRIAVIGGENVSLDDIEQIATGARPGHIYATIARPDDKKGEAVVMFTNNPDLTRGVMVDFLKASGKQPNTLGLPEPGDIVYVPEIPMLAIKPDYMKLQKMFNERAGAAAEQQPAPPAPARVAEPV